MQSAKKKAREILEDLPEDSSYDDILKELALDRMIQRGMQDSRSDRVVSNEEMKRQIRSWQE